MLHANYSEEQLCCATADTAPALSGGAGDTALSLAGAVRSVQMIFQNPGAAIDPYTQALLAVPSPDPRQRQPHILLEEPAFGASSAACNRF